MDTSELVFSELVFSDRTGGIQATPEGRGRRVGNLIKRKVRISKTSVKAQRTSDNGGKGPTVVSSIYLFIRQIRLQAALLASAVQEGGEGT